jgi:hypothetical protein
MLAYALAVLDSLNDLIPAVVPRVPGLKVPLAWLVAFLFAKLAEQH